MANFWKNHIGFWFLLVLLINFTKAADDFQDAVNTALTLGVGVIVAIVIGGIVVVVLVIVCCACLCYHCCCKSNPPQQHTVVVAQAPQQPGVPMQQTAYHY